MAEITSQSSVEADYPYESRARTNSSETAPSTPSSSSDYVTGEADDSSDSKGTVPLTLKSVEALLCISKISSPEDLQVMVEKGKKRLLEVAFGISDAASPEVLQEMIEKCKKMVLESEECSEERKWLVRRLIELRLRAQELRETSDDNLMKTQVMLCHHLVPQKYYIATSGPTYCDHCSGAIWTMLQSWYMCRDCNFCCHWKCVNDIRRVCAHVVASETGGYTYTKDICPEKGLSAQGYRCAECNTRITFKSAWVEPRLCDYSGLFYCHRCHWNSTAVIPARVVRNWDMEPRKVCRSASQLLALLEERPVLLLEQLNPQLFSLIPDLTLIKRLREDLQMMKRYLVFCPDADFHGLPWRTGLRTHFIENSGNFSIKDLVDLQSGILMDEIRAAYDLMRSHITEACELCRARGHLCELCGNDEVIFPWDTAAISCQQCAAVHHRVCWAKRNNCCPRCARIQQRQALKSQDTAENVEDTLNNDLQ